MRCGEMVLGVGGGEASDDDLAVLYGFVSLGQGVV